MANRSILLNNNNMVQIFHKDIKQEYDVDVQVKLEYDYNELKNGISVKTEHELYENHIIKEELVIGPEVMQETHINEHINQDIPKNVNKINNRKIRPRKTVKENKTIGVCICDYCQRSFKSKDQIESHLKDCTCAVCGKHFSFQSNLSRHMKIHTGNKIHKCMECSKCFTRKDYLDTHVIRHHSLIVFPLRTHKPAVCDLCNKSFARKHSRDFHVKHSCTKNPNRVPIKRNMWYVCDICKNKYAYRSSLSSHIQKRHMGMKLGKINECDYCGKKYVKKHNLQCHIQWKHMKISPYKCDVCRQGFKWHCMLFSHQKKCHGKNK